MVKKEDKHHEICYEKNISMNEEKMVCLSHKHAYTYYNKVMSFCKTRFVLSISLLKQKLISSPKMIM